MREVISCYDRPGRNISVPDQGLIVPYCPVCITTQYLVYAICNEVWIILRVPPIYALCSLIPLYKIALAHLDPDIPILSIS